jgi:hypothetical protein
MISAAVLKSVAMNFLVGGSVVASVSVLATWMSPVVGAIWWSFPFSLIPSVYFMRVHGRSNQDVSTFLRSATFAFMLLLIATYAMSYCFNQLPPFDESWWIAVAKGTVIWFCGAVVFYVLYRKFYSGESVG